jgi:hypothetical protein
MGSVVKAGSFSPAPTAVQLPFEGQLTAENDPLPDGHASCVAVPQTPPDSVTEKGCPLSSAPTAVQSVGSTQLTPANEPESAVVAAAIWVGGPHVVAADAALLVAILRPMETKIELAAARTTLAALAAALFRPARMATVCRPSTVWLRMS